MGFGKMQRRVQKELLRNKWPPAVLHCLTDRVSRLSHQRNPVDTHANRPKSGYFLPAQLSPSKRHGRIRLLTRQHPNPKLARGTAYPRKTLTDKVVQRSQLWVRGIVLQLGSHGHETSIYGDRLSGQCFRELNGAWSASRGNMLISTGLAKIRIGGKGSPAAITTSLTFEN